jgi:hypothetical protein
LAVGIRSTWTHARAGNFHLDPIVDPLALDVGHSATLDPSDHHAGLRVIKLRTVFVGADLGEQFGVSPGTIGCAVTRPATWRASKEFVTFVAAFPFRFRLHRWRQEGNGKRRLRSVED